MLAGTGTWHFRCCLLRTDLLTFLSFISWKPKYRQQIMFSKVNGTCMASESPDFCLEEVVSVSEILWRSFPYKWKTSCLLNCMFLQRSLWESEGCSESSTESSQPFKSGSVFDRRLKDIFVLLILWIIYFSERKGGKQLWCKEKRMSGEHAES